MLWDSFINGNYFCVFCGNLRYVDLNMSHSSFLRSLQTNKQTNKQQQQQQQESEEVI